MPNICDQLQLKLFVNDGMLQKKLNQISNHVHITHDYTLPGMKSSEGSPPRASKNSINGILSFVTGDNAKHPGSKPITPWFMYSYTDISYQPE